MLSILSFILFGSASFAFAQRTIVRLESMGYEEVCGLDNSGQTTCFKDAGETTPFPDGVDGLTTAFASTNRLACGFDKEGLKCWRVPKAYEKIDGVRASEVYRKLLSDSLVGTIRMSNWPNVCGVNRTSGILDCVTPYWYSRTKHSFSIVPKEKIIALDVRDELVCWADGSMEAAIACTDSLGATSWTGSKMKLADLVDLKVGSGWICARSKSEGICWSSYGRTEIKLTADMVTAQQWQSNRDGLCALTRDHRITCADPETGSILPTGLGHSIPPQYTKPNLQIAQFWASDGIACVRTQAGEVSCWRWWDASLERVPFENPVIELFGSGSDPCGIMDNGQARCGLLNATSRTLSSSDRIRISFNGSGKCFWNSTGADCPESLTNISIRTITAQDGRVCALSDEGVSCWGDPYREAPVPASFYQPTKVLTGLRHACALDAFGLICWGELTNYSLTIPNGLEQPGRVVDFALGTTQTCAVLDTGKIQCWGRNSERTPAPPSVKKVTSILGVNGRYCALSEIGLSCWGR